MGVPEHIPGHGFTPGKAEKIRGIGPAELPKPEPGCVKFRKPGKDHGIAPPVFLYGSKFSGIVKEKSEEDF
jgi:hypothetical protein